MCICIGTSIVFFTDFLPLVNRFKQSLTMGWETFLHLSPTLEITEVSNKNILNILESNIVVY